MTLSVILFSSIKANKLEIVPRDLSRIYIADYLPPYQRSKTLANRLASWRT
jgi:hypothetical protein